MAHKTMVGGTAYEISGGKTLIDGTAYSIKNGKALIGGTAYEVGFETNPFISFNVSSSGLLSVTENARCIINGITYDATSHHATMEVPIGTPIECIARVGAYGGTASISVNGNTVKSCSSSTFGQSAECSYTYLVKGDATISLNVANTRGTIEITES